MIKKNIQSILSTREIWHIRGGNLNASVCYERHDTTSLAKHLREGRETDWPMKKAGKCRQISTHVRFNGHKINSSSIYIRLDPPGVFCWVFMKINFYISADQVCSSLAKWRLGMLCNTLVLSPVGHQAFWPISRGRQPQTLTPVNCFLLIGSQCKASKGIYNTF